MEGWPHHADDRDVPTSPERPTASSPSTPLPRRYSALPDVGEHIGPWLGAATVVAACNLAAATLHLRLSTYEWAAMLVALGATLAAAGLVAARSRVEVDAVVRDERARPAEEQLLDMVDDLSLGTAGAPGYVEGMERWTGALLELVDHARDETLDPELRAALTNVADDTRALHDLLDVSDPAGLSLNEAAMLHSVCSLWETDQDRIESLAAAVDPRWHRRWRSRTVVERRLRHGQRAASELVLPYRS